MRQWLRAATNASGKIVANLERRSSRLGLIYRRRRIGERPDAKTAVKLSFSDGLAESATVLSMGSKRTDTRSRTKGHLVFTVKANKDHGSVHDKGQFKSYYIRQILIKRSAPGPGERSH